MRTTSAIQSKTNRIAATVIAALLWTGATAFAADGAGGGGAAPGGGGGAANSGGAGGHAAAPANNGGETGTRGTAIMPNANDGAAANHRGNDNGGGQIIGSGGNAGPGLTNAPAKYRTEPAPTGEGGNIRGDKSAATGTNQNQNQRNGYNYGNYGYIGNPWSSDFYGWYGDSYPEGANYYEPVYSDNSNGGQSSPSTAQPAAGNGTQSQSSSTGSNSTVPSPEAAQAQLTNAVDKSPAMVAANTAVQSAQAAYDSERARIISTLKDKPDYQQALARKNTATEHVDAVKGTGNPNAVPTPAVTNAATVKMDASEDVTRIEEQAIAADPKALEAKTKLNTAIADRDALRAKLMAQH